MTPPEDVREVVEKLLREFRGYNRDTEKLVFYERIREQEADVSKFADAILAALPPSPMVERLVEGLKRVSTWRQDCHDYDADMGHPLRTFGDEDWQMIESFAAGVLGFLPPALQLSGSASVEREAKAHAKLVTAQSLMMESGWWTNEAGYLTDAALWIERAMSDLSPKWEDQGPAGAESKSTGPDSPRTAAPGDLERGG